MLALVLILATHTNINTPAGTPAATAAVTAATAATAAATSAATGTANYDMMMSKSFQQPFFGNALQCLLVSLELLAAQ